MSEETLPQDDSGKQPDTARHPPQFGLAALLWTTFVVGLALAYLRTLDSRAVFANGLIAIVISLVSGVVIGASFRRVADATYWSLMLTTAAYLSVAADQTSGPMFHFAWAGCRRCFRRTQRCDIGLALQAPHRSLEPDCGGSHAAVRRILESTAGLRL